MALSIRGSESLGQRRNCQLTLPAFLPTPRALTPNIGELCQLGHCPIHLLGEIGSEFSLRSVGGPPWVGCGCWGNLASAPKLFSSQSRHVVVSLTPMPLLGGEPWVPALSLFWQTSPFTCSWDWAEGLGPWRRLNGTGHHSLNSAGHFCV